MISLFKILLELQINQPTSKFRIGEKVFIIGDKKYTIFVIEDISKNDNYDTEYKIYSEKTGERYWVYERKLARSKPIHELEINKPKKQLKVYDRSGSMKADKFDWKAQIKDFIKFCLKELNNPNLLKGCKIKLTKDKSKTTSFAHYDPSNNELVVYVKDRNFLDVSRSLSHELKHLDQNSRGELTPKSGETGSEHENEANSFAGVVLRKYGQLHPELYTQYINESQVFSKEWFTEKLKLNELEINNPLIKTAHTDGMRPKEVKVRFLEKIDNDEEGSSYSFVEYPKGYLDIMSTIDEDNTVNHDVFNIEILEGLGIENPEEWYKEKAKKYKLKIKEFEEDLHYRVMELEINKPNKKEVYYHNELFKFVGKWNENEIKQFIINHLNIPTINEYGFQDENIHSDFSTKINYAYVTYDNCLYIWDSLNKVSNEDFRTEENWGIINDEWNKKLM